VVPSTPQLIPSDLEDRFARGAIKHVVTDRDGAVKFAQISGDYSRLIVGGEHPGWTSFDTLYQGSAEFRPEVETKSTDPLLLYFTSGTTAKPKLVLHTHASYPVGHLSTMYWVGLKPGDIHWNISSPGWAKHAWSTVFTPWNAQATIFIYDYSRFNARKVLQTVERNRITSMCAPATVWRILVNEDLALYKTALRELMAAGEPLDASVIEHVQKVWGILVRDGYGQTETTAQVGNSPGMTVKPGSMGKPMPGFRIALLDGDGKESEQGEISLPLGAQRPVGLMARYLDDADDRATSGAYYRTGDLARRDADGYLTFIDRTDEVFKSSDFRISPFEIESVLAQHPLIAECAVVPSPDPLRLYLPKAFCVLRGDAQPSQSTAQDIFRFLRERLPAYKRVRRIEFGALPKTTTGKIKRVELRTQEAERRAADQRGPTEFWE
jgi:acetyl-CoA synthetase